MNYILFFFLFNTLSHYEGNSLEALRKNNIRQVQCYNYTLENGKILADSILTVERRFNSSGYPLEILIFNDDNTVRSLYAYEYKQDSILAERKTYKGRRDSLIEISKPIYSKENKKVRMDNYAPTGQLKALNTTSKYNRKGLLSKIIWKEGKKRVLKETYTYRLDGKLLTVQTKVKKANNFKLYYNYQGQKTHIYEYKKGGKARRLIQRLEYDDKGRLSQSHSNCYVKSRVIGVNGYLFLKGGEKITREIDYHQDDTIWEEREYINGKLLAVKRYFYKK